MPSTTITDLRHYLDQDGELAEDSDAIVWICTECGDQGWISGWQGTVWDRRGEAFGEAP